MDLEKGGENGMSSGGEHELCGEGDEVRLVCSICSPRPAVYISDIAAQSRSIPQ